MRLIRILGYSALAYYILNTLFSPQGRTQVVTNVAQTETSQVAPPVLAEARDQAIAPPPTPDLPELSNDPGKIASVQALPKTVAFAAPVAPILSNPPKVAVQPAFVYVTGSRVNVRRGPSTQNLVAGAFSRGAKLVLHETANGWSRISGQSSGNSVSGWMASQFLSTDQPAIQIAVPAPKKRSVAVPTSREVTQARKELIRQSIAVYPGNCACPYHRDRANRKCGKRSAWNKPGGRSPLCYDSDVNNSRLTSYFSRQGKNWP